MGAVHPLVHPVLSCHSQDGEAYRREAGMQVLGGRWCARVEQLESETVAYQARTELEQSKDRCAASLCSPLKSGPRVRVHLVY